MFASTEDSWYESDVWNTGGLGILYIQEFLLPDCDMWGRVAYIVPLKGGDHCKKSEKSIFSFSLFLKNVGEGCLYWTSS